MLNAAARVSMRPMPAHEFSRVRRAKRGAVVGRDGQADESECCSQELAASVEHGLTR
jgi:hypothetical protein